MFFTESRPGLAVFLNAGDPPLPVLADVVRMLDDAGVDCLELAVPFPDSPTDGPVIRRSAERALAHGTTLADTLAFVAAVRPELRRLRIALLADWSHTVRPAGTAAVVHGARDAGCDGLLVHGLPPRMRDSYHDLARDAGMPVVTTCYPGSPPATIAAAARDATAYLYLVARYGRSGGAIETAGLAPVIATLHETAAAPVAVGFGVRSRADVEALHALGADAVVVGSAAVTHLDAPDPVATLGRFVSALARPTANTLRPGRPC